MNKPNYEFKARVLASGYCDIQKQLSKEMFLGNEESCYLHMDLLSQDIFYKEACKINHASYKRKSRLQNFISKMLSNGKCYFITLTFRDDVLESTSEDTRKRYVKRFLKDYAISYCANIDYGAKKEREHYHAVILPSEKMDYSKWHKIGAIKSILINCDKIPNSDVKLAKYVSKLTNHAIKNTTRRNAIIYSR